MSIPHDDIEQALEAIDELGSFLEELLDANGEIPHEDLDEWDTAYNNLRNALRVVDDQMREPE